MHTARQLDVSLFSVKRNGAPASREELLPDWTLLDRLGVIINEPFGAVGASHLIQIAITAFYDAQPSRRSGRLDGEDPRAIYPEIFLFHVGGPHGDHSVFDFWPTRKEVVVPADARLVLDAINDRGITRLAVPESDPVPVIHEHKEPAAARERIASVFVYSPSGRVLDPEWEIAGLDQRTEANPARVLNPDERYAGAKHRKTPPNDFLLERSWPVRTAARLQEAIDGLGLAQERRDAIRNEDGFVAETYRPLDIDTALQMLAPPPPSRA